MEGGREGSKSEDGSDKIFLFFLLASCVGHRVAHALDALAERAWEGKQVLRVGGREGGEEGDG